MGYKISIASVRDVHPRGSTSSEPASRAGLELQPFGNRTELARQFVYFAVQMTTVQDCSEPGLQRSMNLRPLLDPNEFRSNKIRGTITRAVAAIAVMFATFVAEQRQNLSACSGIAYEPRDAFRSAQGDIVET